MEEDESSEHKSLIGLAAAPSTSSSSSSLSPNGGADATSDAYIRSLYASRPRVGVCCRDLNYIVYAEGESTRQLLERITFHANPGTMTAIMGASGSGKSTLLDCLIGEKQPTQGQVHVYRDPSWTEDVPQLGGGGGGQGSLQHHCAYVQQTSAFHEQMTVLETMDHSMRIQLPDWQAYDRAIWLGHLLALLHLTLCQRTRVRFLSGGEQRRLAVGIALISLPSVLLVDEPTSGLDSVNANLLIAQLKHFANAGCTVILTIHQPSTRVFEQFDNVLLMNAKASMFFYGTRGQTTKLAKEVLKQQCVAAEGMSVPEILLEHDSRSRHPLPADLCSKCNTEHPMRSAPSIRQVPSEALFQQCWALLRRNWLNQWRDRNVFLTRVILYTVLSLVSVVLFSDMTNTLQDIDRRVRWHYWFTTTIVATSIACMPALIAERAVYVRETRNGHYAPGSYVLMVSIANLPYLVCLSSLSTLIAYGGIGVLHDGVINAVVYCFMLLCALNCAEANLSLISIQCQDLISALVCGAGMTSINVLFCGYIIREDELRSIFTRLLYKLMFQRYYFSAVLINDLGGGRMLDDGIAGSVILHQLDLDDTSIWWCATVLLVATVIARVSLYICLAWWRTVKAYLCSCCCES